MSNKLNRMGLMLVMILLVITLIPTAEALPYYDGKSYDEVNKEYTIWTLFGLDELVKIKLVENTDYCLTKCRAVMEVTPDKDLKIEGNDYDWSFFGNIENYEAYWEIQEEEIINKTKTTCEDKKEANGSISKVCSDEELQYSQFKTIKIPFKDITIQKGTTYRLVLEGTKKPNERVDWYSHFLNQKLEKWAWWNANWLNKIQVTVASPKNVSQFPLLVVLNDSNMDYAKTQNDGDDVRPVNSAEDAEMFYWIETWNETGNSYMWVNITDTNSSDFYIYYNNAGVSGNNSNLDNTFLNLANFWGFEGNCNDYNNEINLTNDGVTFNSTIKSSGMYGGNFLGGGGCDGNNMFSENTPSTWIADVQLDVSTATQQRFIFAEGDGDTNYVYWEVQGNGYRTYVNDAVAFSYGWNIINEMNNFVLRADGTDFEGFINGTEVGSGGTGIWANADDIYLGNHRSGSAYLNGVMDNVMIFDDAKSDDYIYLTANKPSQTFGAEEENQMITVNLINPDNATTIRTTSQDFACNGTAVSLEYGNISLYVWNTSALYTNQVNASPLNSTNGTSWSLTSIPDGNYEWNCYGIDTTGATTDWGVNRSLEVNTTPFITIQSPTNTTYSMADIYLNVTSNQTIDTWWYENNGGAKTIFTANSSIHFLEGSNDLTVWGNSSNGIENSSTVIFMVDTNAPTITIVSPITNTLYQNDSIDLNITYTENNTDTFLYSLNGGANVSYTPNVTANFTNRIASVTVCMNDTAGYWACDTVSSFYIGYIERCSGDVNMKTINYTVRDEDNLSFINSSFDLSLNYWISDASINTTYTFDSSSNEQFFEFCIYPNWTSVTANYELDVSAPDYPQRDYEQLSATLSNTTTTSNLYLLYVDDGSYPKFVTVDRINFPIRDVSSKVERSIGGSYVPVSSGQTDDAGMISFWLDEDIEYKFTFQKSGYETQILYLKPTTPDIYYINMGGTSDIVINGSVYENLTYSISPLNTTLLNLTSYTFWFNISSSSGTLDSYGFRLENNTGNFLGSSTGTAVNGSNLSITITTHNANERIFGYFNYTIDDVIKTTQRNWYVRYIYQGSASLKTFLNNFVNSEALGMNDLVRGIIAFLIIFVTAGLLSHYSGVYSETGILMYISAMIWITAYIGLMPQLVSKFLIVTLMTILIVLLLIKEFKK